MFLYGPPAVGKYTVGTELARLTGYKLFHNHVTVDVARILFGDKAVAKHEQAGALKDILRLDVIRSAAVNNINLIFTLAYTAGASDDFVMQVVQAVTDANGCVCFVQLHAPRAVLYSRIDNTSRQVMQKPTDPEHLRQKFARGGLDKPVQFTNNLLLDTSLYTPGQAAQRIFDTFRL